MHFEGSFETPVSRASVWEFLLNPHDMAACFPDLQSLEVLTPENYKAKVKVGISVFKRTMDFDFRITQKIPPSSARLVGSGQGGGSGVDMQIGFTLDEISSGTKIIWVTDVTVSGTLAALGKGLLDSASDRMVSEILDRLKNELQARAKA
jgi:carbon monoxide dehydrogenase subunit G